MKTLKKVHEFADQLKAAGIEMPRHTSVKIMVDFNVFNELARLVNGDSKHNIYSTMVCKYKYEGYVFELHSM